MAAARLPAAGRADAGRLSALGWRSVVGLPARVLSRRGPVLIPRGPAAVQRPAGWLLVGSRRPEALVLALARPLGESRAAHSSVPQARAALAGKPIATPARSPRRHRRGSPETAVGAPPAEAPPPSHVRSGQAAAAAHEPVAPPAYGDAGVPPLRSSILPACLTGAGEEAPRSHHPGMNRSLMVIGRMGGVG